MGAVVVYCEWWLDNKFAQHRKFFCYCTLPLACQILWLQVVFAHCYTFTVCAVHHCFSWYVLWFCPRY